MTGARIDTEAAPDVRDLDAAAVLDAAVSARRTADQAEARTAGAGGALGRPAPGHPGAPGRDLPDPAGRRPGVGAGAGVLRPGTTGRGRHPRGGGVRGGGARRGSGLSQLAGLVTILAAIDRVARRARQHACGLPEVLYPSRGPRCLSRRTDDWTDVGNTSSLSRIAPGRGASRIASAEINPQPSFFLASLRPIAIAQVKSKPRSSAAETQAWRTKCSRLPKVSTAADLGGQAASSRPLKAGVRKCLGVSRATVYRYLSDGVPLST